MHEVNDVDLNWSSPESSPAALKSTLQAACGLALAVDGNIGAGDDDDDDDDQGEKLGCGWLGRVRLKVTCKE